MRYIILTIFSYLLFNIAVAMSLGKGGLFAIGVANALVAVMSTLFFFKQVKGQVEKTKLRVSLLGSFGVILIVMGLRGSHGFLPVSLSIELVYNGFACLSWPLFLVLNRYFWTVFEEKPGRFDLYCHLLMFVMVILRFVSYDAKHLNFAGLGFVGVAIVGYMLFNIAIKLAKGHRTTTIAMNGLSAVFLMVLGLPKENAPWSFSLSGAVLAGIGIFGVVTMLGKSYAWFGAKGKSSLVAPLVYDGILVASPLIMPLTGERPGTATVSVAIGMLSITLIRYRHHMK